MLLETVEWRSSQWSRDDSPIEGDHATGSGKEGSADGGGGGVDGDQEPVRPATDRTRGRKRQREPGGESTTQRPRGGTVTQYTRTKRLYFCSLTGI